MAKPTVAAAREYFASGSCPFCDAGPDHISFDEITVEGFAVTQEATCGECEEMWFDVYLAHSIQARRWEPGEFWEHRIDDVVKSSEEEKKDGD